MLHSDCLRHGEAKLGTLAEWSQVARFVASVAVAILFLELILELVGLKSKPRESLVYLRNGILLSLLFSMIDIFGDRLLHGTLLLATALVIFGIVACGTVNRRFARAETARRHRSDEENIQ